MGRSHATRCSRLLRQSFQWLEIMLNLRTTTIPPKKESIAFLKLWIWTTTDPCQKKNSSRVPKKTRLLFKPCRYMMALSNRLLDRFHVQIATSTFKKSPYLNSPYFVALNWALTKHYI